MTNKKSQILTITVSIFLSLSLVAMAAYAVTTVGNDVSIGGTLGVTGATTLTGALTANGGVTGNLTGNVTGNVSGNAGTVTNGVYTTDTGTVTNDMLFGSIAASKLVGTDIATVGTITAGTWQGTAIADAYVADDITASNYLPLIGGTLTGTLTGNVTGNVTGNITSGNTITLDGATGVNEIILTTNLADALSIEDSVGGDLIVFNTITTGNQAITITPATTITGLLTANNFASSSVDIDGGTIGGTTIGGGGTAAAGSFTTLSGSTSLTIGGGTAITKHLSATAANVVSASIATVTCGNYGTVTVTGAAVGDTAIATPTAVTGGIETVNLSWSAYVSAVDTVIIRACNPTAAAIDAVDTQTWRVDVWQH